MPPGVLLYFDALEDDVVLEIQKGRPVLRRQVRHRLVPRHGVGLVVPVGVDRSDIQFREELPPDFEGFTVVGPQVAAVRPVGGRQFLHGVVDELHAAVRFHGQLIQNVAVEDEDGQDRPAGFLGAVQARVIVKTQITAVPEDGDGGGRVGHTVEFYCLRTTHENGSLSTRT